MDDVVLFNSIALKNGQIYFYDLFMLYDLPNFMQFKYWINIKLRQFFS